VQNFRTDQTGRNWHRLSWSGLFCLALFLVPSGCQTQQVTSSLAVTAEQTAPLQNIKGTADIKGNAGDFLAARQAFYFNDVKASAAFYLDALRQDERNPDLLYQSFLTQYRDGNIELAAALARQLESTNIQVPFAVEPAIAEAIKAKDWDAVIVLSDQLAEDVTATPQAGLVKAWALVAAGQGDGGLAQLAESGLLLANSDGTMPAYLQLQSALMAEYLGYHDEAVTKATDLAIAGGLPAKMVLQVAGILIRHDRSETADALLTTVPDSFNKARLDTAKLAAPKTVTGYIANAIVDAALAYRDPQFTSMLPARLQLALYLDPDQDAARFFLAQAWIDLDRFDRAASVLHGIDNNSLWAQPRLLLQITIETETGDFGTAINRFEAYVAAHGHSGFLYKELGDLYRRHEHYENARDNYQLAVAQGLDSADLYRNLGIAHERLDEDPQAEASFKSALERNPNDAFTLNYLGYWWAESGRNLEAAIGLIERAVQLRPNSGFFVDSLGWVHYQLGNYQLAVEFLEKATMLEPSDAVIIEHLGDAYWQSERYSEARYKWRYALELTRDDDSHQKLQSKLKAGLLEAGQ